MGSVSSVQIWDPNFMCTMNYGLNNTNDYLNIDYRQQGKYLKINNKMQRKDL